MSSDGRRSLRPPTTGLETRLADLNELNEEDRNTITNTIDALTARAKLRTIAGVS